MRHVRGQIRESYRTGSLGFVPNIYLNWFRTDGYLPSTFLGHDLISHGSRENGSIEDELHALGCEIWLSQHFTRYAAFRTPESVLAHDLLNSFVDFYYQQGLGCLTPTKFGKIDDELVVDSFLRAAIEECLLMLPSALSFELKEESEEEEYEVWAREHKDIILSHLKYGYWNASKRRYRMYDPYDIWLVRESINKLSSLLASLDEGTECTISYDLSGYATLRVHDSTEY